MIPSQTRIIALCKKKNIPISTLEKDLELSNGFIKGKRVREFTTDRLAKIADYLGVTTDYLMYGEDVIRELNHHVEVKKAMIEQQKQQYPDFLTQKEKELLSYFNMLNEKGQDQAISQLLALTYVPDYQQDTDSAAG